VALRLTEGLRGAERDVWCAECHFLVGRNFDAIFHAIDSADAFLPLLSPDSIASAWVSKEIRVAVTRQLGYRPLMILPVYTRPCEPPPALRDMHSVHLSTSTWKHGLAELIASLGGHAGRPRLLTFEDVVKDRVVVPDEVLRTIRNTVRMDDALGVDTIVMRLIDNVDVASLPDGDRERLVHDASAQRPIPALTAAERAELIRFARGTDERVKRFAVTLVGLRKRHHSGITMETAHEEVGTLLRAEFYHRDPDMRRWKAEELIREATSTGLLMHSREMQEAGFDVAHYLANPSFDYGQLVPLAGPLVEDCLNRRGLDDNG
jgi:hypothetical protein